MRAQIIIFSFWVLAASSVSATTFYVNDDTSAEYTNCSTAPYLLVSAALAVAAVDGSTPHTINVCPGTYIETALMNLNDTQFIDMTITGLSSGPVVPSEVVIQGNAAATTVDVFRPRRSGITIQNLTITQGNHAIRTYSNGPLFSLIDVEIDGPDNDCIRVDGDTITLTRVTVDNCGLRGLEHNFTGTATVTDLTVNDSANIGVYVQNLTGGTFTDITVNDPLNTGVYLLNLTGGTFSGVTANGSTVRGIDIRTSSGITIEDITIAGSIGITATTSDGMYLQDVDNSFFQVNALLENSISDAGTGGNDHGLEVAVGSDGNAFSDFSIDTVFDSGLYVNASLNNDFNDFTIDGAPDDGLSLAALSTGNDFTDFSIVDTTDDAVTLNNSQNNTFTRVDVTNPTTASNDGFVLNATSTGNTLTDVSVDNVVDECIHILGDNTTINGPDVVIGDGATVSNCGDFGIFANTAAGTLLSMTSISTNLTTDDGVQIDNYTAAVDGDVELVNVSVTSATQGITISDSDNVEVTNATITTVTQGFNLLRNANLDITDFTITTTTNDGLILNDTDTSTFSASVPATPNTAEDIGGGANDFGIELITGSDGNTFTDLDIIDANDDGINIIASLNNTFTNVDITSPDVTTEYGVIIDAASTGNTFNTLTVDDVTADCFSSVATTTTIATATFTGCTVRGLDINVVGSATLSGVTVTAPGTEGIYLQALTSGTVSDTVITDSGTDGLSLNAVSGMTFNVSALADNLITGAGDAAGEHGIEIDSLSNNNSFLDFDITDPADDGINLNNAQNNNFTRTDVSDAIGVAARGIVINATSTGNTFTNIVIDNITDDCISILGDDTTITGANSVIGDGASVSDCGDFGIVANTAAGTLLSMTSILVVNSTDDGILIDNYTAALDGDVELINASISVPAQPGLTITDGDNIEASGLTIVQGTIGINLVRNANLEITDFTVASTTTADGLLLNDTTDSTFSSSVPGTLTSSINLVGNGNNDHGIQMTVGSNDNTFTDIDIIDYEDDGINIIASTGNSFTNVDLSNPTITATEGIVILDTLSTGNSFTNVSVDNVQQDCFETLADNTSVTIATFNDCDSDGVVVTLTAGTQLILDDITITDPVANGISITNLDAAVPQNGLVSITDITITDAAVGMLLSATSGGVYEDIDIRSSTGIGLQLTNADSNDFDINAFSANVFGATGAGNATGIQLDTGSDSNTFNALSVVDNSGDGIIINTSLSNTITASQSNDNGGDGIEISVTSASNIIDGNLFLGNAGNGANLSGSGANSFYANCLRNGTNISDVTASTTYVSGSGNFWGSFPADGTGFSEDNTTCPDVGSTDNPATDDDICDNPNDYTTGGASDTDPLQTCAAFFAPNLTFSKTVLTFADDINTLLGGSSPKAIPGATMMYTIGVTNPASTNLVGAAEKAIITDDFTSEITTNGRLSWNTGTMLITSADAGTSIGLTDADDADVGEFVAEQMTARCGDLNVTESCTLTFSLDIE